MILIQYQIVLLEKNATVKSVSFLETDNKFCYSQLQVRILEDRKVRVTSLFTLD